MATVIRAARITASVDGVAMELTKRDGLDAFSMRPREATVARVRHDHGGPAHEHEVLAAGRLGPARRVLAGWASFTITGCTDGRECTAPSEVDETP